MTSVDIDDCLKSASKAVARICRVFLALGAHSIGYGGLDGGYGVVRAFIDHFLNHAPQVVIQRVTVW